VEASALRPLGPGSGGRIRAKFNFAGKNRASAARVHDQQNEIGGLATKLEADAGTFQSHHGWSAPRTSEMLAGAACHCAAARSCLRR